MKKKIPTKIDYIQHCGDCSHRYYEGNDLHCDLTGEKVSENGFIPDTCKLEDAPKQEK